MGKIYAYARVSTPTQRLERQIKNIKEYCRDQKIEKIYTEKYTGTRIDRPQFSQLLRILHPGDSIIFDSVSRMSRTAEEGYNLYMDLLHQDIDLVFIKEPHINTQYYKRMQSRKMEIAKTGKKSVDDLLQAVLDAITDFQNEETQEKIRIAFQQSEKEVTDLHQRISEGIRIVQRENSFLPPSEQKQIGQRSGKKLITKKSLSMKPLIVKMSKNFNGNMSDTEIMSILSLSRNTYYKYKRELLQK